MSGLGNIVLADPDDLGREIRKAVAEAVGAVVEAHAKEVRELRRSLVATKGVLSAHEVGEVLGGVSAETVMSYVKEKGLPCRRPGRSPLFLLDEVRDWVAGHPNEVSAGDA